MARFRIQLLLNDNTWSTQYTIDKNTQYGDSESEWKLLNLDFTIEIHGIKLIFDQIDTAHSDMCFSNITTTHSVHWMDNLIYFKDLFESIPDFREIVLILFSIQIDKNLLEEMGFSKNDINRLNLEFKKILKERHEEYLD